MIIDLAVKELGVPKSLLMKIERAADYMYKEYPIKKKSGGVRLIEHPAKELKALQRWCCQTVIGYLPVHDSVYSYREGRNIFDMARLHARNSFLLRIDLKNFFPSLTGKDVTRSLIENREAIPHPLSQRDIGYIRRIVCRRNRLTIGAPSSPMLSNAILYPVDVSISQHCRDSNVTFSRYADDLYFSTDTPNILAEILRWTEHLLNQTLAPNLRINPQKTIFSSKKHRRLVVGLVLTSDGRVSIGRSKKRQIRALLHAHTMSSISDENLEYLRGYLAFCLAVDKDFVSNLERKYGTQLVHAVIHRGDRVA
jgi:RNA-directed DNA polymerase